LDAFQDGARCDARSGDTKPFFFDSKGFCYRIQVKDQPFVVSGQERKFMLEGLKLVLKIVRPDG